MLSTAMSLMVISPDVIVPVKVNSVAEDGVIERRLQWHRRRL